MKKYTYEEVKKFVNDLGYELISKEYLGVFSKLIIKDTEEYFYKITLNDIKSGRIPYKFHKSNPYAIQNIKLWLLLNNINLQIISKEYKNNKTELIFKDKDGYYYSISFDNLYSRRNPNKFYKSNIFTMRNIKLWCKLNKKCFELIGEQIYENNYKKLKWRCLKDGCREIFQSTWSDIQQGGGCGVCDGRQVSLSNCLATKNPELASEWHPTKNGYLTPYDVTESGRQKVWWKCKNNHEWDSTINNRNGIDGCNCPYCSGKLPSEDYNLLINNPKLCEEWDYNKNDKQPYEYTPSSSKHVYWRCLECSHEWSASIGDRNRKDGKNSGCPECNKSKGEKEIKRIFDLINIYYIPQKEFDDLLGLGNGKLSYDFYLPKYNLLIEYQGEYHDKIILYYKNEPRELAEERLLKQKEHDKRKMEYVLTNGYNFIEIWYWDFDNIEIILNKCLNSIEIKQAI